VFYSDDSTTKLSQQCSVSVERRIDRLTFGLHGEFDLSCGETFQRAIGDAIDERATELVVDLRGLSFIDSTGLHALLSLHARAEREGLDFVVLCGEGHVMRLLKLAGLDELLPVVNPSAVLPETITWKQPNGFEGFGLVPVFPDLADPSVP
jgi:anti-sigma B factor antagonist